MKKCMLYVLLGISLQSCGQEFGGKIAGSGNLITEERSLNNFTDIQAEGPFEVIITQDASQKVTIKTDDNIMSHVRTEVSGNKLRIFFSDHYRHYKPTSVTVNISSSFIEDIILKGSGTIRSTNQLKSKKPNYELSGSGNMNLSVVADAIETSISGSGNIDLNGTAASVNHDISGSGNVNALSLNSKEVKVEISGSGDCLVNAGTSLDVTISGSGEVKYKGAARLTTHISGSGKVKSY